MCGAPGQPVARHTLKQNNIVTPLRRNDLPISSLSALSKYNSFISDVSHDDISVDN